MPSVSRSRFSLPLTSTLVGAALLVGCGSYTNPMQSNLPGAPPVAANDIDIVAGASTAGAAAFSPNPKTVSLAGAANVTIRWVNRDISGVSYNQTAVVHQIVADNGTSFSSPSLGGNATYSVPLVAGTYPFHCSIHPTMVGTLNVTP